MGDDVQSRIEKLKRQLKAACDEFRQAVAFHETWKPAVFDQAVAGRVGVSFASHSFHVIKMALRREMLMSLLRIWDSERRGPRLSRIGNTLKDSAVSKEIVRRNVASRAYHYSSVTPESACETAALEVRCLADEIASYVDGPNQATLSYLTEVRHRVFAHRDLDQTIARPPDVDEKSIEDFYQVTARLLRELVLIIDLKDYHPDGEAYTYGKAAELFWAGVRGESTPGHPRYTEFNPSRRKVLSDGEPHKHNEPASGSAQ